MSGHNKWKQIKHQKGASDAAKSKIFTKIVRLLSVEAKKAKGNMAAAGLQNAIMKAREANMPNDTMERAIKKATTDNSAEMVAVTYEAYGPGGCAMIIEALTDNKNRTAPEVKHILSNHNLALAGIGAAAWAFERQKDGTWIPKTMAPLSDEDADALGKVVDDLENLDDVQEVFTNAE